jgi:hypothetical protein
MCDCSLMTFPNCLANKGEELAAHRFQSGSVGLVTTADLEKWNRSKPKTPWTRSKTCFNPAMDPSPAVCIPPGAQLHLYSIPQSFREQYKVSEDEDVVFTELTAESGTFCDALVFRNGGAVLLQLLVEGQRARALWLETAEHIEDAESRLSKPIA